MKFYAHEEVLSNSYSLEQFLSGGLRESETRHIDLPEDDPELIGHLLDYLYMGNYIYGDTDEGDDVAELLAKMYVMADKHILHHLQVLTVEYFAEEDCLPLLSEESFLKISQYIYENTVVEESVYKDFFEETACEWFLDEAKHLDAYVEPYVRKGDTFAYHIFQAQLQASTLRKNMHKAPEELRNRSETTHKGELREDRARIMRKWFRKAFQDVQENHHLVHPNCDSCDFVLGYVRFEPPSQSSRYIS